MTRLPMISLAIRSLRARPGRTVLSWLGVAFGIAVLVAALTTDAGIAASTERSARATLGTADVRIAAVGPRPLSAATVAAIAATDGVADAAPALEARTVLTTPDRPTASGAPIAVLGVEPGAERRVHDLPIVDGRSLLSVDASEALVSSSIAAANGVSIGDSIAIAGIDGPTTLRVVGIVGEGRPGPAGLAGTVVAPIATLQRILDLPGATRVDVVAAAGTTPDALAAALDARLTGEPYLRSTAADLTAAARASTADVRATTTLIAAVALFVGAFLAFNTLSMTVAERVRELALLRAGGATRRQLVAFVAAQAVVLGGVGGVAGVLLGVTLGRVVTTILPTAGSLPLEAAIPTPLEIAGVVAIAIAVTLASALEPARRVASTPPAAVLGGRDRPGSSGRGRLRWTVAAVAVVGLASLAIWPDDVPAATLARAAAVYLVLFAIILAAPAVVAGLGRVAGMPFRIGLRAEERLARTAVARDRGRTTVTIGALAVGLAMVVAVGAVAQASRTSATTWLASVLPGDELLAAARPVAVDDRLVAELAAVPGVERVSPIATFGVARAGTRLDAAAVRGSDLLGDGRLTFVSGDRREALTALDASGATVVPRAIADRIGASVGSTVTLALGAGKVVDFRVAGIADRTIPGSGGDAILIGWPDATAIFGVRGADVLAVRYGAGAPAAAPAAVDAIAAGAALQRTSLSGVVATVDSTLGRVFSLFDGLALVVVVVGALGLVNTLSMSVLERVRELGVLRAAGMTGEQVRRTVVVEAAILGIVGAMLGVAAGLVCAAILVVGGSGRSFPLDLPWPAIAIATVLGVAVSLVAGWYPARLASRLTITAGVQTE